MAPRACGALPFELAAEAGEERVAAGAGEEGDAARPPVGPRRERDRQSAEAEEVDEVGVGAEPCVRADRVAGQVFERIEGRDRRDAEHVDCVDQGGGLGAEFLQAVEAAEGVGRGEAGRGADDLAHDRIDGVGVAGEEGLQHRVPLGDPGAGVEHLGHGVEGCEVGLDQARAQRLECFAGRIEGAFLRRVAEEPARAAVGNADRRVRRRGAEGAHGHAAGVGIGGVEAGGGAEDLPGVVDGEREDRDGVERAAGRHHAPGGDRPQRGLQPDDVVERGGHPAGPRGVGPEGEGHEAPRHRDGRS